MYGLKFLNNKYVFLGILLVLVAFIIVVLIVSKKKKFHIDFNLFKVLALLIPIISSVIAIIGITLITLIHSFSPQSDSVTQVNLFGIIMEIFAIAISVWIGLNIYNVIEKRDLEDLRKRTEKLNKVVCLNEKTSEKFIEDISSLQEQIQNEEKKYKILALERRKININLLINILINTQRDTMTGYFINGFYDVLNKGQEELMNFNDIVITNLICVETFFNNMYQSYYNKDYKSVCFFANEGLLLLNKIKNGRNNFCDNIFCDNFLTYREGEFNFYLGLVQRGEGAVDLFVKSVNYYLIFIKDNKFRLPNAEKYNINLLELDSNELLFYSEVYENVEVAYLCNTFGEAYNRIIANKVSNTLYELENDEQILLIEYYKKAYIFFCAAVSCENEVSSKKETYYRNLGTFYEKLKALIQGFDRYNKESLITNKELLLYQIDKALDSYEMALNLDASKEKAHITYSSAILKKIYLLSNIEERKYKNGRLFPREEPLYERKKAGEFNFKNMNSQYRGLVNEAVIHFELAIRLSPKIIDSYYGMAKAYLWLALNEKKSNMALKYISKGEKYVNYALMIDKDNTPSKIFQKELVELKMSTISE